MPNYIFPQFDRKSILLDWTDRVTVKHVII